MNIICSSLLFTIPRDSLYREIDYIKRHYIERNDFCFGQNVHYIQRFTISSTHYVYRELTVLFKIWASLKLLTVI